MTSSNWTTTASGYPNAAGAVADFSQVPISSGITVTFGSNVTVGTILLGDTDNGSPYTISAANGAVLTFDNGASAAILKNTVGANNGAVTANILLNSNLIVSNENTAADTNGYFNIGGNGSGHVLSAGSAGLKTLTFANTSTKRINVYSSIQDGVGTVGVEVALNNPALATQAVNFFTVNTFTGGLTISGRITTQGLSDATLGAQGSAITFNGGVLNFGGTFNAANDNTVDRSVTLLAAGGTLEPNSGHTITVSGVINGAGALTKTGSGTVVLTSTNAYAGGTVFNAGRLTVQNGLGDAALGAQGAALTFNGGILNFAGTFNAGNDNTVDRSVTLLAAGGTMEANSGHTITVSGVISGAGTLVKAAAGTISLTGNNTYTGGTIVNAGILGITSDASLGAAGSTVTLNGGTLLDLTGFSFATSDRNLVVAVNSTVRTDGFLNWNGSLSGTGLLTKTGSSTFSLNNTNSNHIGGILVQQGTIRFRGGDGAMGAAGNGVTLSNGTTFASIDDLTLGAGRALTLLSGTANLNVNTGKTLTWQGTIVGAGGLNKTNSGTLVLTGQASYTGNTTISVGTLRVGGDNLIAATSGLILKGGILDLNGHSQTMGTLNLLADSTILMGDNGLNTLIFGDSSAVAWTSTATLSITGDVVSGQSIRVGTNANGLTAAQLDQIFVNGNAVGIDTNGYLTFVPEPAALAQIMGLSALLVVGLRRRSRTR